MYSTDAELLKDIEEETLIQLTDEHGAGVVDWSVVAEKRADVDALIDSYCGRHYDVPFAAPVPRIVGMLSRQLLVHELYKLKNAAPETVRDQHDANMKLLQLIADGKLRIKGTGAPQTASDTGITVQAAPQMFPHDRWDKY